MKEDLIKILNFKLKQIKDNIDNLEKINRKIDEENDNLSFIEEAIGVFKASDHGFDIYKFANITREKFNKLLMSLSDDVLAKFGTNSCNYDGLIYLINGINNGISLTLTQEQVDAINLFIDRLLVKEKDYQEKLRDLNEEKQHLAINDMHLLEDLENQYALIIENIEDNRYVCDIDLIVEAINYSKISNENAFGLLCYLLSYNTDIYKKTLEKEEEKVDLTVPFNKLNDKLVKEDEIDDHEISLHDFKENQDTLDEKVDLQIDEKNESDENDENVQDEAPTLAISNDLEISEEASVETEEKDNIENGNIENSNEVNSEEEENDFSASNVDEYNPILPSESEGYYNIHNQELSEDVMVPISFASEENAITEGELDLPLADEEDFGFNNDDVFSPLTTNEDIDEMSEDIQTSDEDSEETTSSIDAYEMILPSNDVEAPNSEENTNIDNDSNYVADAVSDNTDNFDNNDIKEEIKNDFNIDENEINEKDDEVVADIEGELKKSFEHLNFDFLEVDDINKSLLLKGNLDNYNAIIAKLEEYDLFKALRHNIELFVQMLLYSSNEIIEEISSIVKQDLSVDESDQKITLDILIRTIPSVFLDSELGNYNNFIKNIALFKEYGIDLINLFDFSREVFVADNQFIKNNYEIISNYGLTVNAYNAKYLLLLPNINERIDYYVESMYKDNSENGNQKTFDGLEMIKLYPSRLNTVTGLTIERLRYSSEKGLKVFGNKENSIAGEIANLDVDVINIPDEYFNILFRNEFDIISRDEVASFIKLINNNDPITMEEDELLNKMSGYKVGIRYFIGNIKVSANKVIRYYNILVKNGIDNKKALLFAICYNLVITKTEYDRLKAFVNSLGGN